MVIYLQTTVCKHVKILLISKQIIRTVLHNYFVQIKY